VDDESDTRTYLTTLLETGGYVSLSAADGEEGLKQARAHGPDLIILDIMMPKLGGIEMLLELRKDLKLRQIPVIMLSALSERTFLDTQASLGRSDPGGVHPPVAYIEKPPEPEQLLETVKNSLNPSVA
jgi:CheY-like chemotaxis protein